METRDVHSYWGERFSSALVKDGQYSRDIVHFAPREEHWLGAAPTTGMTHIAIQEYLDGVAVEWLEHVSNTITNIKKHRQTGNEKILGEMK